MIGSDRAAQIGRSSRSARLTPRNQDSRPVSVVLDDRFHNPLLLLEDLAQRLGLAVAEFQHQPPLRLQERRSLRRQPPLVIQAVRAAIQRAARVVVAHLGLQRGDLGARDVGRVADDQVEPSACRQGREAVPLQELDALGHTVPRGVLAGQRQRLGRDVQRLDLRGRALARQRDGQAAAAGAEVQRGGGLRVES